MEMTWSHVVSWGTLVKTKIGGARLWRLVPELMVWVVVEVGNQ